jgi:hypothetical protein
VLGASDIDLAHTRSRSIDTRTDRFAAHVGLQRLAVRLAALLTYRYRRLTVLLFSRWAGPVLAYLRIARLLNAP